MLSRLPFLAAIALGASLGLTMVGAAGPSSSPLFEEVPPSSSGITWVQENIISPGRWLPESMVGGVAFLDYDNDGWVDIYFVNVGPCDFFKPDKPTKNGLYRNNRDGTFTDVTDQAGVAGGTFGMGVAIGDYDANGFPDILVTSYGRCILYHNNGDGTFADVTDKAGVATPGWTTSAVWFDYDNDGKLDLLYKRLRRILGREELRLRPQQAGQKVLLHSADLHSHPQLSLPQQRRRDVYLRRGWDGHRAVGQQGHGGGGHRRQSRRPHRFCLSPTIRCRISSS